MDLQDKTRMQDTFKDINLIIDKIGELRVFPPLVWVWTWDVAITILKDVREGGDPEFCVTVEEEELWELFWRDADKNAFSLTHGDEDLYEAIRDWMMDIGAIEVYDGDEEDEEE